MRFSDELLGLSTIHPRQRNGEIRGDAEAALLAWANPDDGSDGRIIRKAYLLSAGNDP